MRFLPISLSQRWIDCGRVPKGHSPINPTQATERSTVWGGREGSHLAAWLMCATKQLLVRRKSLARATKHPKIIIKFVIPHNKSFFLIFVH